MKTYTFQEQIDKIRKEAIELGFSVSTLHVYYAIWEKFILWKDAENFVYDEKEYSQFLLEHYNFDTTKYTSKAKSHFQQLMRSKRMLDNFDEYKLFMFKRVVNNNLKLSLSETSKELVNKYKHYCLCVNSENNVKVKENYITNMLVYFEQKGMKIIEDLNNFMILELIKDSESKGNRSKSRYFGVLRDFLKFVYDEGILNINYAYLIPSCRTAKRKKLPTYIKTEKLSELLNDFPRTRKIDKRNYAITLMAAELGMRVGDILNLKLDDIDWKNKEITFIQQKTTQKNILPLSNEVGWALIDYINNARPITQCRNVFVRHTIPFNEIKHFGDFNKYFSKEDIGAKEENKNGIHNLRHSLAKRMLDNEIPLPIISETMGHASEETERIYLKIDKERLKECCLEVDL